MTENKNRNKKRTGAIKKFFFLCVVFTFFALPFVSAFGVTTPYWDTKPLVLAPGGTSDLVLELQNMVGGEDILLRASVVEGAEFVTLLDTTLDYLVPFGTKDVKVPLRISLPESFSEGAHRVSIAFREIPPEEGKMVQMSGGVRAIIPLLVQKPVMEAGSEAVSPREAKPFPTPVIMALLAVTLLLALALAFVIGYRFALQRR
ncbi:MAG: hypothetical protein Q8R53_00600 [Nanoarchaeota archaeon]|nr:hypothetical protein [Nanoarchaeota archaeon]